MIPTLTYTPLVTGCVINLIYFKMNMAHQTYDRFACVVSDFFEPITISVKSEMDLFLNIGRFLLKTFSFKHFSCHPQLLTQLLMQRLSLAIQRGNAASIVCGEKEWQR